ncbi:MAG: hypothetical protein EZS28_015224 [Streblomastix strix]|uniref:Uncharacterized protein n=1 Tax=Streblomastix strix TaxID=222440 RepID=A0A5J4W2U5_9EUKA|nr:MAG: hypothetical protein EZS28_015224 [Streblomastix strix]
MDYWWDGTSLRALEAELPDMGNVMTIFGAATGGDNAIADLSFDENTLYLRKIVHIQRLTMMKLLQTQDDALLLLKADKTELIDAYSKTEDDKLLALKLNISDYINAYSKQEVNALIILKVEKTELIDAYSKTDIDALLDDNLNVSDQIDVYSKTQVDALLLLKADKSQLIDAYTEGEADNLLNNKADSGVSYAKGEDDDLLLLKENQSTTYIKTETEYFISQNEVDDVDLSCYMTLGTVLTIIANNTFNNACRIKSSIDEMSSITQSSFIKSGAEDSVVLLGASGSKPISEFFSSVDDSNYVKKRWQYDDYITLGAVKNEFGSSIYSGSISGNLTLTSFIKSGEDDSSILLAGGGD